MTPPGPFACLPRILLGPLFVVQPHSHFFFPCICKSFIILYAKVYQSQIQKKKKKQRQNQTQRDFLYFVLTLAEHSAARLKRSIMLRRRAILLEIEF